MEDIYKSADKLSSFYMVRAKESGWIVVQDGESGFIRNVLAAFTSKREALIWLERSIPE